MDPTRPSPPSVVSLLYCQLRCVLCQHLPTSPLLLSPCGHLLCSDCYSCWCQQRAGVAHPPCPECIVRSTPITSVFATPQISGLLSALRDSVAEISLLESIDISGVAHRPSGVPPQGEDPVKTIDMELDPDGLDGGMTLLTHRYFRVPETASAKVVLKAVVELLAGAQNKPTHLFVTAGKPQKVVLKADITMKDVKWLFDSEEVKKITVYYTSRP